MTGDRGRRAAAPTEFVVEEFETTVPEGAVEDLAAVVETAVRRLRSQVRSDERLEELLRSEPGETVLTSADTTESGDPEPLTQRAVVEPLLSALGYESFTVEAGDLSAEYGMQADYAFSLADVADVDSERLLFEAEPLGKRLHQQRHGVGQVQDWLERRQFAADFGVATDGLRWVLLKYDPDTYGFDTLAEVDLQPVFARMFETVTVGESATGGESATAAAEWLDDESAALLETFVRSFGYENVVSVAGEARDVIKRRKREITEAFYDDYVRLVFGITEDGRTERSLVGGGVEPPPEATGDDVRLFAVELMNRLVFVKFLEDKGLVSETLLADLVAQYEESAVPQRFYEAYLVPLFFRVLDERPADRIEQVRNRDIYADVPYLDGGLFRETVANGGAFDETDFAVSDSVLLAIVDLLEEYRFSADGGPGDLDPSVLGNVFEKTINHITTDAGDQQKELGAYYTPDEITRFCAEETVQPGLLERFADRMVEEWGWTREMADAHDDVYDLIAALPETNTDVVEDLLGIVDRFRALDPACGSGHFLTSVASEIVAVRTALYDKHDADPDDWELRKQTVVRNIYGVDIVSPAVEIAKLRLWLSIIAEVDPDRVDEYDDGDLALPNVVFNVRQGNSLIGFTGLVETRTDDVDEGSTQAALGTYSEDAVGERYGDIIDQIEQHKNASDSETARRYLIRAERLMAEFKEDIDEKIVAEFHDAGLEEVTLEQVQSYEPFHWVLEFAPVYEDGGFDVVVGNPPWEVLSSNREEYFARFDPLFRTRPDSEKAEIQRELLEDEEIAEGWEEHQARMDTLGTYFKNSPSYELQSPDVGGQGKTDLAMLFLERIFSLTDSDGYTAHVFPGKLFTGTSTKGLREHLLSQTTVGHIIGFENKGIFEDIHNQYKFGIVSFKNSGTTEHLRARFLQRDIEVLEAVEPATFDISADILRRYSPRTMIFPQISREEEIPVLEAIVTHDAISDSSVDGWYVDLYREELNRTRDSDRFLEDEGEGDYPVYGGGNIWQFCYNHEIARDISPPSLWSVDEDNDREKSAKWRIREKNLGRLKKAIYEEFDGSGSQIGFVNELLEEHRGSPLSERDVRLDCTEYRIGMRHIANNTNERSLVAAVLPKGVVCHDKCPNIRPYELNPSREDLNQKPLHGVYERIFSDEELFATLGLLNSVSFDYIVRTKLDTSLSMNMLEESQMPRLTDGDDWFHYISTRAARLNCYGEPFAEMRERLGGLDPATDPDEREQLQAEIDAAAFHAYGLDREETAFVLEDFHRVENPRLMTDAYFDRVLEVYDDLADAGPMD